MENIVNVEEKMYLKVPVGFKDSWGQGNYLEVMRQKRSNVWKA